MRNIRLSLIIGIILYITGLFGLVPHMSTVFAGDTVGIGLKIEDVAYSSDVSYSIIVTVVDSNNDPVESAKVTLSSDPVTKYTDEDGIALFENVLEGNHRLVIEYNGQVVEREITVDETANTFEVIVQIEESESYLLPETGMLCLYMFAIGVLILSSTLFLIKTVNTGKFSKLN